MRGPRSSHTDKSGTRRPTDITSPAPNSTFAWGSSAPEGRVSGPLRRKLSSLFGFDLLHAWQNRRLLFSADIVWTHTEREHLAVAFLQRMRPRSRRVPVVAQSVWLWDKWSGYGKFRRRFVAWLLHTHSIELVHSRINLDFSRETVPGRRVEQVPFGTSTPDRSAEVDDGRSRKLVVAVGNDADRDWASLAGAARALPSVDFRLATRSRSAASIDWPGNVVIAPAANIAELDRLYAQSAVIVVSTRPNRHASGATSLIEALATGRPTVATRAGGLEDYASTDARLVPPGSCDALTEAIEAAVAGLVEPPSADGHLARGLTQLDYVQRYVLVTKWILGGLGFPDQAFRFTSVVRPTDH